LDDLARQLNKYLNNIASDPMRLEEIEARIDLLQKLKRKYGGPQTQLADVIGYADGAERELAELQTMDQKLAETGKKLAILERELIAQADSLSGARKKTAVQLEKAISQELSTLSFTTAEFKAEFEPVDKTLHELTQSGWDRVEFMFSANPGEPLKPLVKIASGGELSRLLLGLKCILARRDQVGTVIFDEVDAGIGGVAATAVGRKLRAVSGSSQILCVTHLPQVAAFADHHHRVIKREVAGRTLATMECITGDERVREMARMLGGAQVTDQTLLHAKELIAISTTV
jgi:DNA repair protein RecN (Recombination protein N)